MDTRPPSPCHHPRLTWGQLRQVPIHFLCHRQRRSTLLLGSVTILLLWWVLTTWIFTNKYMEFQPKMLPRREITAKYFVLGRDREIYMYSAIANVQPSWNSGDSGDHSDTDRTEIVVTSLDRSRASFQCCVLLDDATTLLVTPASDYYRHRIHRLTIKDRFKDYFFPKYYVARQLACTVPSSPLPKYVTLTSSHSCSPDVTDYLPVIFPPRVPGGLALCAKIAHSGGLDPEKVIEWFEMQKILGVDKILMYDMGNPDGLNRVFKYYQRTGMLDLQPYELPGLPKNRSLKEKWKRTPQFEHDETLAVLECRQRMSGYNYVISHDVDEFIIPRKNISIKSLLQNQLSKFPQAAGLYFFTAFFITTWSPTNPEEDLMVARYRKTRVPRWEAYKYVYLTSRVITSVTHEFFPKGWLQGHRVPVEEAYLHHYRACPKDTWGRCNVETIIDNTMTRYGNLEQRVLQVRQATSTSPKWIPVSGKDQADGNKKFGG